MFFNFVGQVVAFAGSGVNTWQDGQGSLASFKSPSGISIESFTGIIWVSDSGNYRIRRITSSGNEFHG